LLLLLLLLAVLKVACATAGDLSTDTAASAAAELSDA
jgi:hypothetical protein